MSFEPLEPSDLPSRIEKLTGRRVTAMAPLAGGCVSEVLGADLADGDRVVVKLARGEQESQGLEVEAWMLGYLAAHSRLPVPGVVASGDGLLVLTYIDHDGGSIGPRVEEHAAELLAELHEIGAPRYGLERDTVIGGVAQPNPSTESWPAFFRDHRLIAMGRRALEAGSLTKPAYARLERLAGRLEEWIAAPQSPSLIHGDLWGGNVLVRGSRVAGFVDPAIYFADAEIELAFTTLFSTFGEHFFRRYAELRPIAPGFFEERRDLYNLYPLLVHAVLFGSSYGDSVDRVLRRYVGD